LYRYTEVVLVVNIGKRPKFPSGTPKQMVAIVDKCWDQLAKKRPAFQPVVSWWGLYKLNSVDHSWKAPGLNPGSHTVIFF
jgi:hypothetical protein